MTSVYLAVGHGRRPDGTFDPGATSGNVTEQTAGDVVVGQAAKVLAAAGVTVTHEAYQDDPNFPGTTAAANRAGVDLLVTVHHDWTGGVDGVFGFWYPGSGRGERATRLIVEAAREAGFDVADRWVRERGNLYVLNQSSMPATLIECGRIGTYSYAQLVRLGDVVADGVLAYFGIPRKREGGTNVKPDLVIYARRGVDFGTAAAIANARGGAGCVVTLDSVLAQRWLDRGVRVVALGGGSVKDLRGEVEVVGAGALETLIAGARIAG